MSSPLNEAAKVALEAINAVHSAFGAPGNFGYGTREGDALFALYRARSELLATVERVKAVCPTCDDTGKKGRHSICRDCDETA